MLLGTHRADAILASGHMRLHQQAGHMTASDPIKTLSNTLARRGPSTYDMCAASDAAHMPRARMGVRGSGPIQDHALEAPVAKLVFLIPSQSPLRHLSPVTFPRPNSPAEATA